MKANLNINLSLDANGIALGVGRVKLLKLIDKLGSLSKAAAEFGMSYRSAWGKIKRAEDALQIKLIEGIGSKREGSKLTEEGKRLVNSFEIVYANILKYAEEEIEKEFSEYLNK